MKKPTKEEQEELEVWNNKRNIVKKEWEAFTELKNKLLRLKELTKKDKLLVMGMYDSTLDNYIKGVDTDLLMALGKEADRQRAELRGKK